MTWVMERAKGTTELDQVWGRRPELYRSYMELYRAVMAQVEPTVIELCRLRMATLLGSALDASLRYRPAQEAGLTEAHIAALTTWPSSALFDERQRACLGYTEQFVIDVNGVSDADVAKVLAHMDGQDLLWLTTALQRIEAFQRSCVMFGIGRTDHVPDSMPDFVLAGDRTGTHQ